MSSNTIKSGNIIARIYPVGAIYISTLSTNPATLFGFGTWEAFGEGRTLVGKASSGTFNTAEATGGAETVTLTGAESGEKGHNHTQDAHGHTIAYGSAFGVNSNTTTHIGDRWDGISAGMYNAAIEGSITSRPPTASSTTATNQAVAASNASSAHNNLQPYIVTYMWKRTA